jgi:hypothetical protein
LREAFFVWCKERMAGIEALKGEIGITDDMIKARKHYKADWFMEQVPCFIPRASALYQWVWCAVFETFSP